MALGRTFYPLPSTISHLDLSDLRAALEQSVSGRYNILRELGRGGMGAVFLAQDLALDREVAIKVLPPELAEQPSLRERFVREARLAASLSHPNIVHVHAVEEQGDLLAIVMQFVDGETLTQRVARSGPYDAPDIARLLQDTAWALGYAHGRGVVHRDVKPDNLMIERGTGRALILDFGIARQERSVGLTEAGQSIGTPHYMSPEQAAAEEVDGRSDLYSLGCVGFFAATGRPLFDEPRAHKLLMRHLTEPAPSIASVREGFPEGLDRVIGRLLAKDPNARYDSGEALAEGISDLQMRSREVAPVLRLFHQQTAQSFQALAAMLLVFAVFWWFAPVQDTALRLMIAIMFAVVSFTIVTQSLDRVRYAVRRGFTVDDVQAAFRHIGDEVQQARDQLISDPLERARIQRRKRFAITSGFVGGFFIPMFVRALRGGRGIFDEVQGTGTLLLILVTVAVGSSVAMWAMRPVRVTMAQRLAGRFWGSRLGRRVFARAEERYSKEMLKV